MADVLLKNGFKSICTIVCGDGVNIGAAMVKDPRVSLLSFTGSTAIGRSVSTDVHKRFGRTILELGGNNAVIVMPDADLELVFQGSIFSAVGTCGQRCTSLRRIMLHESVYDAFVERMVKTYKNISIGDPMAKDTLVGRLHTKAAVKQYVDGLVQI